MSNLTYKQKQNIKENFIQICQCLADNKLNGKPLIYINSQKNTDLYDEVEGFICEMSLETFIRKLIKALELTSSHIAIVFLYIDLISQKISISNINIKNLIFTAAMICTKFLEDNVFMHQTFSRLMGYEGFKVAEMEEFFLVSIDFLIYVSLQDFQSSLNFLKL